MLSFLSPAPAPASAAPPPPAMAASAPAPTNSAPPPPLPQSSSASKFKATYRDLADLVNYEGYWTDTDRVLSSLGGFTREKFDELWEKYRGSFGKASSSDSSADGSKGQLWATILVLSYLEEFQKSSEKKWGLLKKKAIAWLRTKGVDSTAVRGFVGNAETRGEMFGKR
jgi:hypothetical protein